MAKVPLEQRGCVGTRASGWLSQRFALANPMLCTLASASGDASPLICLGEPKIARRLTLSPAREAIDARFGAGGGGRRGRRTCAWELIGNSNGLAGPHKSGEAPVLNKQGPTFTTNAKD